MKIRPPKIFISYSHADEEWKNRLKEYLNIHVRLKNLVVWDDREIRTGKKWNSAIEDAILDSDILELQKSCLFLIGLKIQQYL